MLSTMVLAVAVAPTGGPFGLTASDPFPPVFANPDAPHGFVYAPARDTSPLVRLPAERYCPQPGDVLVMSNPNPASRVLYAIALTGPPTHAGVVVRMPDGRPGVLEAGFDNTMTTQVTPAEYRLNQYPGRVWVRRRKEPLTPEQDARLTAFAGSAAGGRFSYRKFAGIYSPFRARGPVRTFFAGRPNGPQERYFCTEIILEGLVYAGVIPSETARPTSTFPRELFFDQSLNPYISHHPPLACGWEVPRLWTPCVGTVSRGKDRPQP